MLDGGTCDTSVVSNFETMKLPFKTQTRRCGIQLSLFVFVFYYFPVFQIVLGGEGTLESREWSFEYVHFSFIFGGDHVSL